MNPPKPSRKPRPATRAEQPLLARVTVSDLTERQQTEETLRFLVKCGVTSANQGFFQELAGYLARALGMDFVCIDRLEEGLLEACTLAVFHNGKFEDNVSYALKDTPCGEVVGKTICCFPRNARGLFPKDAVLQDLQAESYLGVTLWSSQGKPIGLIAVIGRQPLTDSRRAESLLQLVAVRAAGELERQQAEEALRASEARYRSYLEVTNQLAWSTDANGMVMEDQPAWTQYTGQSCEEMQGWGWTKALHPDDGERTAEIWRKAVAGKKSYETEYRLRRHDGVYRHFLARGVPSLKEDGGIREWVGICIDITARKQAEEELRRLNRTLRAQGKSNQALLHTQAETELLHEVCQIIVNDCGHALAWIGYAEEDAAKSIRPVAWAGFEEGYLETLRLTWADTGRGRGPTGMAIRTAKPSMCRNMLTDPKFAPWRKEALHRGYASSIALPLMAEGRVFGALTLYSRQPDPFSEDEVKLLGELASDLAYGIGTIRLRQAHEQAQAKLVYLASFPERNPSPVMEIDVASGGVVYLNPATRQLFPDLEAQAAAHPFLAGLPAAIEALRHDHSLPVRCEATVDNAWYAQTISSVPGGERVRVYTLDISRLKQAEAALSELSQRLTYHVDHSPLAVIEWGPDMRLIRWSGEAERVFGWQAEEVLGKRMEDLRWLYVDDERQRAEAAAAPPSGGPPRRFSACRNYRKDGSIIHCEWYNSSLLDESGWLRSILSLVLDVTERTQAEQALQESEERLRLAQQAGRVGTFERNLQTQRTVWSAELEAIYGLPPGGFDGTFTSWQKLIHPDDLPRLTDQLQSAVVHNAPFQFEYRILRPDGEVRWLQASGKVLCDERGEPVRTLGANIDVTERKRADEVIRALNADLEQRVRSRTAELEASNKELEAFCYSVSHDLRGPLRGIDGFSQALLEDHADKLDADGLQDLQWIRSECQKLGHLIDDLLNLSRLTRSAMARERVDLSKLAGQIAANLKQIAPERTVEFRFAESLRVEGDPRLLQVALSNLLENAWKYTSQRPDALIELGALESSQQGGGGPVTREGAPPATSLTAPVFFVRDNGVGFDMAYADKLFTPFQRLHSAREFPGTGIGLATVHRVIHRHGGRIWAQAAIGQGATFFFTLREENAE